MTPLADLSRRLAEGTLSARALVEQCLERIADPAGEGARAFISVAAESARQQADRVDQQRRAGRPLPPFAGIPLAIKDLFDLVGEITCAGSRILADRPPAQQDAPAIARLRRAGFIFVGRTNMTEFAYSGLGLNPHYGTPLCTFDRAARRIPGGSTSGGAVAVADGMAAASLGTVPGARAGFRRRSTAWSDSSRPLRVYRATASSRCRTRWIRWGRSLPALHVVRHWTRY